MKSCKFNNLLFILLFPCFILAQVVINEVFYDPVGSDGAKEWIELFNNSDEIINLLNWKIYSAGSSFKHVLTLPNIFIQPKGFLLITEDSTSKTDIKSKLAFQNGGGATDAIKLTNADESYLDIVFYDQPNSNNLLNENGVISKSFAPDVKSGNSLARYQDGYDTNSSKDDFFESNKPTPKEDNILKKPDPNRDKYIKINEVFYDPVGSDEVKEWIELFNNSNEIINLLNWKIYSAGSSFKHVLTFPNIFIQPKGFLLITEDSTSKTDIKSKLAFQNGGGATDAIKLTNADESYLDIVFYDQPNSNNLLNENGVISKSFAPDVKSGNSLARYQDGYDTNSSKDDFFESKKPTLKSTNFLPIDLEIESFSVKNGKLYTTIVNLSTSTVKAGFGELYLFVGGDLIDKKKIPSILPKKRVGFEFNTKEFPENPIFLKIEMFHSYDYDNSNNIKQMRYFSPKEKIVINEVMANPLASANEWIELYNQVPKTITINNFKIIDLKGDEIAFSASIGSGDFLVICQDSVAFIQSYPQVDKNKVVQGKSWASLNNSKEELSLTDEWGNIIDSISYNFSTSSKNLSFERFGFGTLKNIWGSSISETGSTPTKENSIFVQSVSTDFKISVNKKKFYPKKGEKILINYTLRTDNFFAFVSCTIFDLFGREKRELFKYKKKNVIDNFTFDGKDNSGDYLDEGVYILIFNASVLERVFSKKIYLTVLN